MLTTENTNSINKSGEWFRKREIMRKLLLYAVIICVGITMIFPFLWMVSTSLKETDDAMSKEFKLLPKRNFYYEYKESNKIRIRKLKEENGIVKAREIFENGKIGNIVNIPSKTVVTETKYYANWKNYFQAWKVGNLGRAYINNLIIALLTTFGQVLTSSLAAYAFSRLEFPGRDAIFLAYLGTMMIPDTVTLIPNFILTRHMPFFFNWLFHTDIFTTTLYLGSYYIGRPIGIDSYFSLIVPGFFTAYGTFMLRQFFMGIPKDLDAAAKIDGAGYLRVWWHVILPVSMPALATLTIFTFMGTWRTFIWPLIIIDSPDLMPLMVALQAFRGQYSTNWSLLMAGSVIIIIPILIVFIFGQRYFTAGIRLGAIKE